MKLFLPLLLVAFVVLLPLGLGSAAAARQEAPELADRVAALETKVKKLEEERAKMMGDLALHQELLGKVFAWFRGLPELCTALDKAMLSARDNGFEKAGPNPRAKRDVLEGLRAFAAGVDAKNPTKRPERR